MQARDVNSAVLNTGSFGAISGIAASVAGAIFVYLASIWVLFPTSKIQLTPPYNMWQNIPGNYWLISPDVLVDNYLRGTAIFGATLIVSIILLSIGMYGICVAKGKRNFGISTLIIGILAAVVSTSTIILSIISPSYVLVTKVLIEYIPQPTPYLYLIIQVGADFTLFFIAFLSLAVAFLLFGSVLVLSRSVTEHQALTLTSGVISIITGGFFAITAFPFTWSIFGPTAFILMTIVSIALIVVFFTTSRR